MGQQLSDRPAFRPGPKAVLALWNVFGDLDRILAHRAKAVGELVGSVIGHILICPRISGYTMYSLGASVLRHFCLSTLTSRGGPPDFWSKGPSGHNYGIRL